MEKQKHVENKLAEEKSAGGIILTGPLDHKPSKGERENLHAKEQKEKLTIKDKLDVALVKLRQVIKNIPEDKQWDRQRAEHTLRSVEGALGKLGKDGKYEVAVEPYAGNPQAAYTQREGVPVDELIDILKDSAKEINKNLPTKATLKDLKTQQKELLQRYEAAHEMDLRGDNTKYRHTLYSEWQEAVKAYERAEKAYDLGYFEEAKELHELAGALHKNSKGYFETHYTKKHGDDPTVWTQEERNRQDLRTRLEAKLISDDYRGSKNHDNEQRLKEDYIAGTNVLKYRRELVLTRERKPKAPKPEQPAWPDVPTVPQPPEGPIFPPKPGTEEPPVLPPMPKVPQPPEGPLFPPKPEAPKTPDSLLAVDVSDVAEQLARQRGTERLNEVMNRQGVLNWFNKQRHRIAEEYYRQKFFQEELAKIKGKEENVFGDPKKLAEHKAEMQAELTRFQEDLFRTHGGESKETLKDEKFNADIKQLMKDYVTNKAMSDEDFTTRKYAILQDINKKYPNSFGLGLLSADNFLEAGREFRKIVEHSEAIAKIDSGLRVDLAVAKRTVKTDANLRWIDKAIANIQKIPVLSGILTPTALAAGLSVGTYLASKPAYWLAGAAGAGLLMGGLRRAKDVKVDVATHRMERAMGRDIADFGDEKGRRMNREKMEEHLYATRPASEIKNSLSTATGEILSGNLNAMPQLINDIADAEARMSLAETNSIDLIHYEGERVLSRSRLELLRIIAEAKVQVKDKAALDKAIGDRMTVLSKDVGGVDNKFAWFRAREAGKAALVGGLLGGTIGLVVQEGLDKLGVHPPDGKQPALERLWHLMRGDSSGAQVPTNLAQIYSPLNQTNITVRVPQGTSLIQGTSGMSSLVDTHSREVLADQIIFGKDGQIFSVNQIPGSGISVESQATHTPAGSVREFLQANRHEYADKLQEIHRHAALMNDTTTPDLNELKLRYGGVNGTGYDAAGNVVLDLQNLTQSGSFQGSRHPDMTQLLREGKLKLLITPDAGNQHEAIVVDVDPSGKVQIPAATSHLSSLFGKDANGRLTHPGFLEAVIADADGKFTPIATDPDTGRFVPGAMDGYQHTFHKSTDRDWNVPPFIPIFPRKALENYKGSGNAKEFGRKIAEPKFVPGQGDTDLPDINEPIRKFGRKLKVKTEVASRGQILEGERDLGAEYPSKQRFYTPREIATRVLYRRVPLPLEDLQYVQGQKTPQTLEYLEKRIQADKEKYEGPQAKERYGKVIAQAYKAVDTLMSKYGNEKRSQMPSMDKIHLSGFYEYFSQAEDHVRDTAGLCFTDSGEIFINMYALEKMEPDNLDDAILHVVQHELVHDAVTNNYWGFEAEVGDEKVYASRRTGLKLVKRVGTDSAGMPILKERGRALNEAVTEELALEAYKSSGGVRENASNLHYVAERRVLKAIQERFKIDFKVFAEAVVNRRKLPELVRAMSKSGEKVNSDYVSMLVAIMDYESNRPQCRDTYPQTINFINGRQVDVDMDIYAYLGRKSLDKNGYLKDDVQKKYNIRMWSPEQKRKAA